MKDKQMLNLVKMIAGVVGVSFSQPHPLVSIFKIYTQKHIHHTSTSSVVG